jgi:hypothetical protein
MSGSKKKIAIVLLIASLLMGSLSFASVLATRLERSQDRPAKSQRSADITVLSEEPVMRIALSTDARAATISTTAELLNASSLSTSPQPLETARVRVESRLLSPVPQSQNIEVVLGARCRVKMPTG